MRGVLALLSSVFVRRAGLYLAISFVGLVVDYLAAISLIRAGLPLTVSAFAGYVLGLFVILPLLKRFVFATRYPGRLTELLFYASSGLLGAVVTSGTVWLVAVAWGSEFSMAKLFAVGASFLSVFAYRYLLVFAKFGSH